MWSSRFLWPSTRAHRVITRMISTREVLRLNDKGSAGYDPTSAPTGCLLVPFGAGRCALPEYKRSVFIGA